MATRVRAGRSDRTVMGASRTGSYEVTATRPDVREDATGHGRQISAKTARRRSALRVRPRPMAPPTSSLSAGRPDDDGAVLLGHRGIRRHLEARRPRRRLVPADRAEHALEP